jgi:hypothetical protein
MSTYGEESLPKVLIISPIIHIGGILHDPVCVLPIKTTSHPQNLYMCILKQFTPSLEHIAQFHN